MTEDSKGESAKLPKIIEPQQRNSKPSPKPASKKIEETRAVPIAQEKAIDSRKSEKVLLFAGIPATVLIAVLAQYIYHNYYIIPLEERTLLNVVAIDYQQIPWIARTNESSLSLIHKTGHIFTFEYLNIDEKPLEWFWMKGNEKFGRLSLSDSYLEAHIYFSQSNWQLLLALKNDAYEKRKLLFRPSVPLSFIADVYQGKIGQAHFQVAGIVSNNDEKLEITLKPGDKQLLSFNFGENELPNFYESFRFAESEYDHQFDVVFQLKLKAMPEFYQNMGKAALSLVLSSLYTEERSFKATGTYNKLFYIGNLPFTHLHLPEGCEDLGTQGLAALSIVDLHPSAVLQLIMSWTNLVNRYGNIPSNVSGTLDYTRKLAPALFLLIDEYIHKNGILSVKPIYKNIEKIGLNMIALKNSYNLLEFEEQASFFESTVESKERIFSVESQSIAVIASRILCKLSKEYGSIETAKKFFEFNEVMDSAETLFQFLKEDGSHSNFVLKKKDGKEVKEFVEQSDSLAPFIFRLLSPTSKELENVLKHLEDPQHFWSNYGIHYSRQGISVAHNFMILRSLMYYAQQSSPNQGTAHALYARLRNQLIMFIAQDFKKTKTFWEFYNTSNGQGEGRKNWLPSATILKVMAEFY